MFVLFSEIVSCGVYYRSFLHCTRYHLLIIILLTVRSKSGGSNSCIDIFVLSSLLKVNYIEGAMDFDHPRKQKWTNDVGKLIFLYKHNPGLYNGLSLNIDTHFVELTVQLNRISANAYNIEEVIAKMKALRKKMVNVEMVRRKNGVQPKWKHYEDLKFLVPYLQELNVPAVLAGRKPKTGPKEELCKKDRDAYVDSFVNCIQMDLKKIKSPEKQDRLMRKIRSVVDVELKKL